MKRIYYLRKIAQEFECIEMTDGMKNDLEKDLLKAYNESDDPKKREFLEFFIKTLTDSNSTMREMINEDIETSNLIFQIKGEKVDIWKVHEDSKSQNIKLSDTLKLCADALTELVSEDKGLPYKIANIFTDSFRFDIVLKEVQS